MNNPTHINLKSSDKKEQIMEKTMKHVALDLQQTELLNTNSNFSSSSESSPERKELERADSAANRRRISSGLPPLPVNETHSSSAGAKPSVVVSSLDSLSRKLKSKSSNFTPRHYNINSQAISGRFNKICSYSPRYGDVSPRGRGQQLYGQPTYLGTPRGNRHKAVELSELWNLQDDGEGSDNSNIYMEDTFPEFFDLFKSLDATTVSDDVKLSLEQAKFWVKYSMGLIIYEQEKTEHLQSIAENLDKERENLQRELLVAQVQLDSKQLHIDRLNANITRLGEERDELIGKKFVMRQQIKDLGVAKDNNEIAEESAQNFLNVLQSENVQLKAKAAEMEKNLNYYEQELASTKVKMATVLEDKDRFDKLLRYYAFYIQQYNPNLIINLLDKEKIEKIQLADMRKETLQVPKHLSPSHSSSSGHRRGFLQRVQDRAFGITTQDTRLTTGVKQQKQMEGNRSPSSRSPRQYSNSPVTVQMNRPLTESDLTIDNPTLGQDESDSGTVSLTPRQKKSSGNWVNWKRLGMIGNTSRRDKEFCGSITSQFFTTDNSNVLFDKSMKSVTTSPVSEKNDLKDHVITSQEIKLNNVDPQINEMINNTTNNDSIPSDTTIECIESVPNENTLSSNMLQIYDQEHSSRSEMNGSYSDTVSL